MARVQQLVARRYGLAQVALVLGAVDAYELLRRTISPDWPLAIAHAREIESLEQGLHIAWEAPFQRAVLHVPALVDALSVFYVAASFVLTGAFFWWLYRRSLAGFRRFRNAFLAATACALAVHAAFPTAPPRLAGLGIEDTLRTLSGLQVGSVSNPVAAIPSLHAGWALGVGAGLVAYGRSRVARAAGVVYPGLVVVATVATGNHFELDAAAGMALVALALVVVHFFSRRGVEQSGSSPGS